MTLLDLRSSNSLSARSFLNSDHTVSIGLMSPLLGGKRMETNPAFLYAEGCCRKPSLSCHIFNFFAPRPEWSKHKRSNGMTTLALAWYLYHWQPSLFLHLTFSCYAANENQERRLRPFSIITITGCSSNVPLLLRLPHTYSGKRLSKMWRKFARSEKPKKKVCEKCQSRQTLRKALDFLDKPRYRVYRWTHGGWWAGNGSGRAMVVGGQW